MVFFPLTLTISSCLIFSCAVFAVREQLRRRLGAGRAAAAPDTARIFAHASTSLDSAVHGNSGPRDRSTP